MSLLGRREIEHLEVQLREERSAHTAAEAEVARLRACIDAVPAGIVMADSNGRPALRNPAAVKGGHVDALVDEVTQRLLREASAGSAGEQRLHLFGPPQRVLLIRGIPLEGRGALAIIDDLSERVRLEAVRTDFVANISHELKTPVAALALLAEALADSDDPEVNRHLAEKMVEEAHRASRTIDDLMELSRIELGGNAELDQISVAGILGESVGRHRLTADTLGVGIEVEPAGDLEIVGDRLQLVSAVSNLVDNAVKYSNCGGTVYVSASAVGDTLEIEVSDEGIGIPSRDLGRIFERFYRVDRARSRETGGTGLGLAIVRHVANNHGGEVTVESHEGEGSTFVLRIPLRRGT